jgi:LPPG:FO 2-phospho-L-lactate transferase
MIVVLSGGVGGARLVDGLARVVRHDRLVVVANSGDDLWHWGLRVCPDLDTLTYTLAGRADPTRGWGRADERFLALETAKELGGDDWFAIGDRDLGLHVTRTAWLRDGVPLSEVTRRVCAAFGVGPTLLPASETPWETRIRTDDGELSFQEWLVRRRAPPARAIRFEGDGAPPTAVLDALDAAELVVFPPSNPFVSIDPILALPGVRERVAARPVVAVSPLVAGRAVKGPLAENLRDLVCDPARPLAEQLVPSIIVDHYGGLVDRFVYERGDPAPAGVPSLATGTVMNDVADRVRLAREVLAFAGVDP